MENMGYAKAERLLMNDGYKIIKEGSEEEEGYDSFDKDDIVDRAVEEFFDNFCELVIEEVDSDKIREFATDLYSYWYDETFRYSGTETFTQDDGYQYSYGGNEWSNFSSTEEVATIELPYTLIGVDVGEISINEYVFSDKWKDKSLFEFKEITLLNVNDGDTECLFDCKYRGEIRF